MEDKKTFFVTVPFTAYVKVEVEASNKDDAKELANNFMANNDFGDNVNDIDWDINAADVEEY